MEKSSERDLSSNSYPHPSMVFSTNQISSTACPNELGRHHYSYTAAFHDPAHCLPTRLANPSANYRAYRSNIPHKSRSNDQITTPYYDHIYAQFRARASFSTTKTNSIGNGYLPNQSFDFTQMRKPPKPERLSLNQHSEHGFRKSSQDKPSIRVSRLSREHLLEMTKSNDEVSLDYPNYTIDVLIERMVPTDTYKPQISFIYTMLLCSRIHIRTYSLLEKLTHLTIQNFSSIPNDRRLRISQNFLDILSYWIETFPYDFRQPNMLSQLETIFSHVSTYEPRLQERIQTIHQSLLSKLKLVDECEDYIRKVNQRAAQMLRKPTFTTDIVHECPTPILFAQQVTHIELDRLKPIGAEELIQYFIVKSASEDNHARPRKDNSTTTTSTSEDVGVRPTQLNQGIHEKKSTIFLEAYIQWANRLTDFITTEIVKHTQRSLRVRLINYFIEAADQCFRLHNFNSMIAILGGLNTQPVRRLKKTWSKVPIDTFKKLEQYTDVSRNFSNYRSILKTALEEAKNQNWTNNKIVIPFTSLLLKDIYFIKTHSGDYTEQGGINLKKYQFIADSIAELFSLCKQSKVSFDRNEAIINYVIMSPTFSEDALMLASFECEPAITPQEKEQLKMLPKPNKRK